MYAYSMKRSSEKKKPVVNLLKTCYSYTCREELGRGTAVSLQADKWPRVRARRGEANAFSFPWNGCLCVFCLVPCASCLVSCFLCLALLCLALLCLALLCVVSYMKALHMKTKSTASGVASADSSTPSLIHFVGSHCDTLGILGRFCGTVTAVCLLHTFCL